MHYRDSLQTLTLGNVLDTQSDPTDSSFPSLILPSLSPSHHEIPPPPSINHKHQTTHLNISSHFCYFVHIHSTTSTFVSILPSSIMSSTCDNCDCADKSQCTKKRTSFGVQIVEKNYNMSYEMEMGENDCKCGPSCTCTSCTCHSA